MENKDMINELKNIKDKLREFTYIINRIIKELELKEQGK
jgi:hypothetical protein